MQCLSIGQVAECISLNAPDLDALYLLYANDMKGNVRTALNNESTLRILRNKFKLGPPPTHRNTFPELYFEYSETHLSAISYQFFGIEETVWKFHKENFPISPLIMSMSYMDDNDRKTLFHSILETVKPYSGEIPSLNLIETFARYFIQYVKSNPIEAMTFMGVKFDPSDNKGKQQRINLASMIFGMACFHGDTSLSRQLWNDFHTLYPSINNTMTSQWCIWSLAGGHRYFNVDIVNKYYWMIIEKLIRYQRIELIKELSAYRKSHVVDITDSLIAPSNILPLIFETNNLSIVKMTFDMGNFIESPADYLGRSTLEIVKYVEINMGAGKSITLSSLDALRTGNFEVFNYIASKYGISSMVDIVKMALEMGYNDIYNQSVALISDDELHSVLNTLIDRKYPPYGSELFRKIILGSDNDPTILCLTDDVPMERLAGNVSAVMKIKFIMKGKTTKDRFIARRQREADLITYGISRCTDVLIPPNVFPALKYFMLHAPTITRTDYMIECANNKQYDTFRVVLYTIPKDEDLTLLIKKLYDPSLGLHRRFLQMVVRGGYRYNPSFIPQQIQETINKMI